MSDSGDGESSNEEWETPAEFVEAKSDDFVDATTDSAADNARSLTPIDEWTHTDDVDNDDCTDAVETGESTAVDADNPPVNHIVDEKADLNPFHTSEASDNSAVDISRPTSRKSASSAALDDDGPANDFTFLAPADPFAAVGGDDRNSRPPSQRSVSSFNLEETEEATLSTNSFNFSPPAESPAASSATDFDNSRPVSNDADNFGDQTILVTEAMTFNAIEPQMIDGAFPQVFDASDPLSAIETTARRAINTPRTPPSTAAPVSVMVEDMLNDIKAICDQKSGLRQALEEARYEKQALLAALADREKALEIANVTNELNHLARESEKSVNQLTLEKFQVISETRELGMGEKIGHMSAVVVSPTGMS
jgi:hypothetical protein